MREKIGIIGFGNMGAAIGERLKAEHQIYVFDKDKNKTRNLAEIKIADNIINLVDQVNTVILAVKPQDFDAVLSEIKNHIKNKLLISIAAGITTGHIEKCLGRVKVIRVMPNILAKIGEGMACLSKGKFASEQEMDFAKNLFDYLGKTISIEEKMINAATAISGSGPAYVCEFLESQSINDLDNIPEEKRKKFLNDFQKAAVSIGFSPEEAGILVDTTFLGTIGFLKKTKLLPVELKKQVASKGGTTEAALEVLEEKGSLEEAVQAALGRAQELSRG